MIAWTRRLVSISLLVVFFVAEGGATGIMVPASLPPWPDRQEREGQPGREPTSLPLPPIGAFEREAARRELEEAEHRLADAEQHVDEWGPKSPIGRNLMLGMILFGAALALVFGVFFRRKGR